MSIDLITCQPLGEESEGHNIIVGNAHLVSYTLPTILLLVPHAH